MARYALLLRGVNVGAKNSLPMAELRGMLEKLGCTGVRTYLQSGNAVFQTALAGKALTCGIEEALEKRMGRPIATTLRTRAQMKAIVQANPLGEAATDLSRLCVLFLAQTPKESQLAPLRARSWEPERFRVIGREIYTWHPDGIARSPLALALGKLRLQGAATMRNWNTILGLWQLLGEP